MVALLVLLTIIIFLTVDYFAQRAAARRTVPAVAPVATVAKPAPVVAALAPLAAPRPLAVGAPADPGSVPEGVFLGPGHAWLGLDPTGMVRIGADRLPLTILGGVDAVTAAPAGTEVRRGEPIARLTRGSRSLELASPVDGVVVAANPLAESDPEVLAGDPFGDGWIATVRPRALGASLQRLFVGEEAAAWTRAELARLRDFLVGLTGPQAFVAATLPDGGLPLAGLAAILDDGEWRELVARFFAADAA